MYTYQIYVALLRSTLRLHGKMGELRVGQIVDVRNRSCMSFDIL